MAASFICQCNRPSISDFTFLMYGKTFVGLCSGTVAHGRLCQALPDYSVTCQDIARFLRNAIGAHLPSTLTIKGSTIACFIHPF